MGTLGLYSKGQIGKYCLSQWFESPYTIDKVNCRTSEQWMMAQKALLFEDWQIFEKIINCEKPGEAKTLGRFILGYEDFEWNKNKYSFVKQGIIHKFNQNPDLADYLLSTGDKILVEASPLYKIWGIGLSENNPDVEYVYAWQGENLLGFA